MKVIILLGRQGSGKGTQVKLLTSEFRYVPIGSGDLLRSFYEGSSFSAKKTKEVLNQGGYVPTPVIFRLWMEKLESIKESEKEPGIIFDGSPRKILEAYLIDQALEWYGWDKEVKRFLIDISRPEAEARLSKRRICAGCSKVIPWIGEYKNMTVCDTCGGMLVTRPDDTPEAIKSRLDLFDRETQEVIEYYKKANALTVINGEQPIEKVYKELASHL